MEDNKIKLKNIKDLEYNKILNQQNIVLVLIGTAIITVSLTNNLPQSKSDIIIFLILVVIFFIVYFSQKLDKIKKEIENI